MGIYTVKPLFQKTLTPVTNWLINHRVHPDTINMMGLAASVGIAICIYFSPVALWTLLLVPVLAFIRTASNALDGLVSRALGAASAFGEVLNEFLDRISDALIFYSIALLASANIILGSVTVIVILLNSYLSIVSKAAGGTRQYGGIMGKADRMIYLGMIALWIYISESTLFWNYFMIFILVGTSITLIQRFMTIKRELSHHV
jgi:CDP-diacylglycerol--glycerol-3-phosphate 3-phosphatidyltransferase